MSKNSNPNDSSLIQQTRLLFQTNSPCFIHLCFFQCLDYESIENLITAMRNFANSSLILFAEVTILMQRFINMTDQSMYYPLFDQPEYLNTQQQILLNVSENTAHKLVSYYKSFCNLLELADLQAQEICPGVSIKNHLISLLFDPELPLPHLKKELISKYCTTPLQEYVALQTANFENIEEPIFSASEVEELFCTLCEKNQYHIIVEQFKQASKSNLGSVLVLRFCPNQIRSSNLETFLIPSFPLHNLLICLFALSATLAECSRSLINLHESKLSAVLELSLRSNIFRNMILAFEDNFRAFFALYENLCKEIIVSEYDEAPLCFWNTAQRQWSSEFEELEPSFNLIINELAARQRQTHIEQILSSGVASLNAKNTIVLEFPLWMVLEYGGGGPPNTLALKELVETDSTNMDFFTKDYVDYLFDQGITLYSIHFCGHSNPEFFSSRSLRLFSESLITNTISYYEFLKKQIFTKCAEESIPYVLSELIRQDFAYITRLIHRPSLTAPLLERINKWFSDIFTETYNCCQLNNTFKDNDEDLDRIASKIESLDSFEKQSRRLSTLSRLPPVELFSKVTIKSN